MKSTLYDALGISPTSSDEEVRAALRGLIRKYYAKTRDGQGNVEEALRFINHASRILGDSERRERYDAELSRTEQDDALSTTPQAVVQAMADQIDSLASDRARLRRMSEAGYSFATTQQWKDRAVLMEQLYRQVLAQRGVKQISP